MAQELLLPIAHALRLRLNEEQRREEDDRWRVELAADGEPLEEKPGCIVVVDLEGFPLPDPATRCRGWSYYALIGMLAHSSPYWQSEAWACMDAEWADLATGALS